MPDPASARAKKTGEDGAASDAVPEPGAPTNAAGRARRTSWIIQSLRSRFGGTYLYILHIHAMVCFYILHVLLCALYVHTVVF